VFDDHPRPSAFVWIAAALLVVAVGYRLLKSDTSDPPPVSIEEPGAAGGPRPRGAGPRVYVHVAGAVKRPGLYRLRHGARVAAALARAGGPTRRAELTGTNLAARVQDGQQVVVPVRGQVAQAAATGATGAGGQGAPAGRLSLATATQAQLEELDGIGPTLAARIIEYRDEHGGFRSVEELGEVDGIGEVRLEALREAVQP